MEGYRVPTFSFVHRASAYAKCSFKYTHFLCLSIAISVFCNTSEEMLKYANSLIEYFVQHFSSIYGMHHLSYNVHNLIHLYDDVKSFGPLDSFSAFKFENYMFKLKQKHKHSRKPLEQVVNRFCESRKTSTVDKLIQDTYILKYNKNDVIQSVKFRNCEISSIYPNNGYLLKSNEYLIIHKIIEEKGQIYVEGLKYKNIMTEFFESPCKPSSSGNFCCVA